MSIHFIKRHPKKITALFVVGGIGLGSYLCFCYVKQRLESVSQDMEGNSLEYARKKHHFHSNLQTADSRIFSLSSALREKLLELVDVDFLIEQLKEVNGIEKFVIWENLKISSLSRLIAATYLLSGLILLVRIELNIIGGIMFRESVCQREEPLGSDGSNASVLNGRDRNQRDRLQKRYIEYCSYLIEVGAGKLMTAVEPVVRNVLSRISLKQVISFAKFDEILNEIRCTLESREDISISLQELFLPPANPDDDRDLCFLLDSTRDILEQDFLSLLTNCVKLCFLYISQWTAAQCPVTQSDSSNPGEELTVQFARLVISISKCFPVLFAGDPESLLHQLLTKREVMLISQNIYEAYSSN